MPRPRSEITATNIGDNIYLIRGFDRSGNILYASDRSEPDRRKGKQTTLPDFVE